jgi:hypothetical protein
MKSALKGLHRFMGFWKTLKFWDTQAVIEATIETSEKQFRYAKAKYPDRDCHAWLAYALGARPGWKTAPVITFTRTTLYSVLRNEDAPAALGCYILTEEIPRAIPRFQATLVRLIGPAYELLRQGEFSQHWEQKNPWTAANVAGIREVVAATFKKEVLKDQLVNLEVLKDQLVNLDLWDCGEDGGSP